MPVVTRQLALEVPLPEPPADQPVTYWENRGPRNWQPVHVILRYGNTSGHVSHPLPHVTTKPHGPRNVLIQRADGHQRIVPVRTLRRRKPT